MARKAVFRIRFSETEANLLAQRAQQAGIHPTRYARIMLFPTKKMPHPLWNKFEEWIKQQNKDGPIL